MYEGTKILIFQLNFKNEMLAITGKFFFQLSGGTYNPTKYNH